MAEDYRAGDLHRTILYIFQADGMVCGVKFWIGAIVLTLKHARGRS